MAPKLNLLPEVTLTVDGQPVASETHRWLENVRVSQRLSQPSQCELTFGLPSEETHVDAALHIGAALKVSLSTGATTLFNGDITAIEYLYGPHNKRDVRLRAYDRLHRLRQQQSVRFFADVTVAAIARTLCADLDLSVEAAEDSAEYQYLIQGRESDWQFLLQLAERSGLYLCVRDDVLHLLTLEGVGTPIELSLGAALFEATVEVNNDSSAGSVRAQAWFPTDGESFKVSAAAARSGRDVKATAGASPPARTLVDAIARNDTHASQLAQAELDWRKAVEVTLWGVADGNPQLRPGARVQLGGMAQSHNGRYVLTEVTHTIDGRMGYVSEISSRLPAPPKRPSGSIATLGEVSAIDDPYQQGRVRVKLPTFDDVETDWMGVVVPGAGANKGLIALPGMGDLVLVLLAHEDPAHGVVLGGFYGQVAPPDVGIEGGARKRFTFVTPQGQRIHMDDSNGTIHVQNASGSFIDLTPDHVKLHSTVDLQIEAPGKQIAISAAAIDFNKA
ncbi:MAG TPA: contractile injection system protein, VgrG/Pvc8 family [Anaerolineae bacterium]|jgi:uncharacterized protein involved in type VI secretion and phage assembly